MSTPEPVIPANDLLSQIWSVTTTLSDEAMNSATGKCTDAGFDPNRGVVPLQESFINLSSARSVLEDAIEKQKLIHLPITVQKEMLSNLQAISKALQGLIGGVDEVVNLTNAIEALNTSIWKYGFHNLSDQVLGYQKKLNQLKAYELQVVKVLRDLEPAQQASHRAVEAAKESEHRSKEVTALVELLQHTMANASAILEKVKESEVKTNSLHSTVEQHERQSGELFAGIKTTSNELVSLDASIRKFYGEVDAYRKKIMETSEEATSLITTSEATVATLIDDTNTKVESFLNEQRTKSDEATANANATIESSTEALSDEITKYQDETEKKTAAAIEQLEATAATITIDSTQRAETLRTLFDERSRETLESNNDKTKELIGQLQTLKEQIREQIQQATGFTLFGAFQSRQNEIVKAKNRWAYAIAALVVVSACATVWIAHEAQSYTVGSFVFYVKLSLTIPLVFAITFCTVQYNRERRLEEEYAFKSSISVSLNPYRDLIQSMLEKDEKGDLTKYIDFVIDSVRNVFTPPTDKVFEPEKKTGLSEKALKQTAQLVGTVLSAAKQK